MNIGRSGSSSRRLQRGAPEGSVLIIVLWVVFGLVAITLYFAHSMSLELKSADQRAAGIAADQAIEGATRYLTAVLTTLGTNGALPDTTAYQREAVPVGDARFWLLGRDTNGLLNGPNLAVYGLTDEAARINLNTAPAAMLELLPRMTTELAGAIVDWRDTDETVSANGAESETYALLRPPYLCKNTNFETIDELRLVAGATMDILTGEDSNRNGILDPDEFDEDRNNRADPGVLEYVTVYSREPNTRTNGQPRIDITSRNQSAISNLLQTTFGTARAIQILRQAGPAPARSPLEFYVRGGMKIDEFAQIGDALTTTNGATIDGLINVNTASEAVLTCIPGIGQDKATSLVNYRRSNSDKLTTVAWLAEVLDRSGAVAAGPYVTTRTFQFGADIAAVGPYGRGYRRMRVVFDVSSGTPKVIYRQDLSHLGWALGRDVWQTWLLAKDSR